MITTEQVSALVGKNVELICFANYSVNLHFQERAILSILAGCEHTQAGQRRVYPQYAPVQESSLMSILENSISSAMIDTNGDLCLTASNDDTLRIFKEPAYESYHLKIGGGEIIA